MALVGLDLTTQYSQYSSLATPNVSSYVLTPDKLETVIAHAVAQLIWIGNQLVQIFSSYSFCVYSAGQIGTSNGGLDIGNGMADAVQEIVALRLNVSSSRM